MTRSGPARLGEAAGARLGLGVASHARPLHSQPGLLREHGQRRTDGDRRRWLDGDGWTETDGRRRMETDGLRRTDEDGRRRTETDGDGRTETHGRRRTDGDG